MKPKLNTRQHLPGTVILFKSSQKLERWVGPDFCGLGWALGWGYIWYNVHVSPVDPSPVDPSPTDPLPADPLPPNPLPEDLSPDDPSPWLG
jgi:hypothetical protein